MKLRPLVIAMATVGLAGCATTDPEVVERVITVQVKVKDPCIAEPPTRPTYRTGKIAKPISDAEKAGILVEDFEKAEQYGLSWETAAAGCVIAPAAGK